MVQKFQKVGGNRKNKSAVYGAGFLSTAPLSDTEVYGNTLFYGEVREFINAVGNKVTYEKLQAELCELQSDSSLHYLTDWSDTKGLTRSPEDVLKEIVKKIGNDEKKTRAFFYCLFITLNNHITQINMRGSSSMLPNIIKTMADIIRTQETLVNFIKETESKGVDEICTENNGKVKFNEVTKELIEQVLKKEPDKLGAYYPHETEREAA